MSEQWPIFDLRLYVEDLELRIPNLDDLEELAALAEAGIHPAEEMPFGIPWTDAEPAERGRSTLQHHWKTWSTFTPEAWFLSFAVLRNGVLLGNQGMGADKFAITREVGSGSWLGRQYQGKGVGKLMRSAILGLLFDGLDGQSAISGAWLDNPASRAVSKALGYAEDGYETHERRGKRETQVRYRMTAEQWRSVPRPEVGIVGLEACLPLLVGEPASV